MSEETWVERRVVEAAQAGELLDVSEEDDRDVRAVVIRDLLCGKRGEFDPRGVRLRGARIVGELDLTDVRASIPLVLRACEHDDPVILVRAHLPHLDLSDSTFPALNCDDFVCEHDADLSVIGCQWMRLRDATISGRLNLAGARLAATNGPALHADGLTLGSDLFLSAGFEASSDSSDGTVRLFGADITGQLNLAGARLAATNGPALHADGLTLGDNLYLSGGFTANSDSDRGTVRLLGADITGQLNLTGARLAATNGPALHADGLTLGNNLFLSAGFKASSDSSDGTLRLSGANITGQLNVVDAAVRNVGQTGPALDVQGARVDGKLNLSLEAFATEDDRPFLIELDGFRYPFMPEFGKCQDWLGLLARHTPGYTAQPYQRLAEVYRAAGHDQEARRTLIAQQHDLRQRGDLGNQTRKLLHRASWWIIGYGHRPWRALGWLVCVLVFATALATGAALTGTLFRSGPSAQPCGLVESVGYAIDTAVPLLKTGGGTHCEITTTTPLGTTFYAISYLPRILGWALATLFVAGYTGLIRKHT